MTVALRHGSALSSRTDSEDSILSADSKIEQYLAARSPAALALVLTFLVYPPASPVPLACAAPAPPVPSLRLLPRHEQLSRSSKALPAMHHQNDAHPTRTTSDDLRHAPTATCVSLCHCGGGGFPSPTPPSLPLRTRRPSSAQSRSHRLMRPLGRISSTAYTATVVPSCHSRLHTPSRIPSPSSAKYRPRYTTRAPVAASPIRPDYLRLAQYLRQPLQSPTPPSSRTPFDRHYRTWRDGGAASGQRVCHAA
ncbi:hypothetical protein C8F04DRAFT_1146959 [Mycena alexandri]|uniref:Uncharacterized protein n=1 Tax=Mycena alexandri TaxID=1745969 RepID=A0AAD6WNW2_9AGAR|nr:hypothetical protein C8F04DRAFT_1146959 [Mycena alexandri]